MTERNLIYMDSLKKPANSSRSSEETDLGTLIYKFGRSLKQLSDSVGNVFVSIGRSFLLLCLFLMKNILWLAAGTALGFIFGQYVLKGSGTMYYSEMTVRANFNSSRALYNSVDYFNALSGAGDAKTLASVFSIDESQAEKLRSFSVQPVKSELSTAELYKKVFLQQIRSEKLRQDTFWTRTITYEEFKKSLANYDYPLQKITVIATDPLIFKKLEQGFINQVSENTLLQQARDNHIANNSVEERVIGTALRSLDTLRSTYNQRLLRESPVTQNGTITLQDNTRESVVPELELYDKMLELLDELKMARQRSVTENDIMKVYSAFNPAGQPISLFRQSVVKYTIFGFLASLAVLMFVAFYKYLVRFERGRRMVVRAPSQTTETTRSGALHP